MAISLTDVAGLLKTIFVGPINSSIQQNIMLLNQIKFVNRWMDGYSINHPINLVRNMSLGFRSNSTQALPQPSASVTKQVTTSTKTLFAYLEFYGDTLRATQSKPSNFAYSLTNELQSCTQSIRL